MATTRRQSSMTLTDPGDNDDEGSPVAKRPRVAAACDQCRVRKAKCDAVKPGTSAPISNLIVASFYCCSVVRPLQFHIHSV